MSLLNRKHLFIHINKSGGGIITNHMKQNGKTEITGRHRTLSQMLQIAKQLEIDITKLKIFTVIRNPWERMLSMYLFYHPNNYNAPEFFSGNDEIDNDFNKWISWIYSPEFPLIRKHSSINIFRYCFNNQLNWITDNSGNINENVKIIRYENINKELYKYFKDIMKIEYIDLETKIHPTKHSHYSSYYNEKSIQLVKKHYILDINKFGYTFDLVE
jgi:hypothetical protein